MVDKPTIGRGTKRAPASVVKAINDVVPPAAARGQFAQCGARLRKDGKLTGDTCPQIRGYGTDHPGYGRCKRHGGGSPGGKKFAAMQRAEEMVEARKREMRFYGVRAAVDPETVLLEEMQYTAGVVRWLRDMVGNWPTGDTADDDRRTGIEAGMDASFDGEDTDEDRRQVLDEAVDSRTGLPQLVAVHSTLRAIGFTDTEYAAWLKILDRNREQLVRVAKACLDAGIEERRQQVLEARAQMMRDVFGEFLTIMRIKASPEQITAAIQQASATVAKQIEGQIVA